MTTATVKNMTSYYYGQRVIIPFDSVSSVSNINTSEITVYLNRPTSTYAFKDEQATKFLSEYLAWLDSQSLKSRSL